MVQVQVVKVAVKSDTVTAEGAMGTAIVMVIGRVTGMVMDIDIQAVVVMEREMEEREGGKAPEMGGGKEKAVEIAHEMGERVGARALEMERGAEKVLEMEMEGERAQEKGEGRQHGMMATAGKRAPGRQKMTTLPYRNLLSVRRVDGTVKLVNGIAG